MMHGHVTREKGTAYYVETHTLYGEPVEVTIRWTIPAPGLDEGEALEATWSMGTVRYATSGGFARTVPLPGNQEGEKTSKPLPPPKTSCRTRYQEGRWRKLHKSRGWIDA